MSARKRGARGELLLVLCGVIISCVAFVTYFTLIPNVPDLRDSGHVNFVAAVLGFVLSAEGARRAFLAGRWRVTSVVLLAFGTCVSALLGVYIYYLTYQLPPAEGVVEVGVPSPGFRLPDQHGDERTLGEFAGRRVVLVFFRGHW